MDQRIIDLYNTYIHGSMPRRDFLQRLAGLAGSAGAATALLPALECNYARAAQVAADHADLETAYASYRGTRGDVRAYVARPKAERGALPGVLVIHENRGLNAHIEDVARRAALAGYLAVAPDGLSAAGGTPADQEKARDLFAATDRAVIDADVIAGVGYLAGRKDCSGKLGAVGFCYGGGIALQCAAEHAGIGAAVAFYGAALPSEKVASVKAALMMHYAGKDERIDAGIDDFRHALDAHAIAYSVNMYPGTQHGFHNDSSEARYDASAAKLAWSRTIAFFDHYLKA